MRMLSIFFWLFLFSIPSNIAPKVPDSPPCSPSLKVEQGLITVSVYCVDKEALANMLSLVEKGAKFESVFDHADITLVMTSKKNIHP